MCKNIVFHFTRLFLGVHSPGANTSRMSTILRFQILRFQVHIGETLSLAILTYLYREQQYIIVHTLLPFASLIRFEGCDYRKIRSRRAPCRQSRPENLSQTTHTICMGY